LLQFINFGTETATFKGIHKASHQRILCDARMQSKISTLHSVKWLDHNLLVTSYMTRVARIQSEDAYWRVCQWIDTTGRAKRALLDFSCNFSRFDVIFIHSSFDWSDSLCRSWCTIGLYLRKLRYNQ
jgi:hypothetical protein